ncbi:hypothetical protein GE21DRAFT_1283009 [Neurospora crassa]|nr:hypothetical protein GE21DRAFT_1283009 [Neurospora crassa]
MAATTFAPLASLGIIFPEVSHLVAESADALAVEAGTSGSARVTGFDLLDASGLALAAGAARVTATKRRVRARASFHFACWNV